MSNLLKRIFVGVVIAIVMMCVHHLAHAAGEQTWKTSSGIAFSNPYDACSAQFAKNSSPPDQNTPFRSFAGASFSTKLIYNCMLTDTRYPGDQKFDTAYVTNPGVCAAGSVYNPTTGLCGGRDGCKDVGTHADTTGGYTQCVPDCASSEEQNATGQCIPKKLCAPYELVGPDGFCRADTSPSVPKQPNLPPHNPTSPPKSDGSCPAGTANVGSDSSGTAMCQGTGTPPTDTTTVQNPTVTTTNSDGSKTTTDSNTATNSDGSKTTNTTTCTTAVGGTKTCDTTSTTGVKGDGTAGKADGTGSGGGGAGDDTCTKHPELNICNNSQVSGGGCSGAKSAITIKGDAIQGAILRKMRDDDCANLLASPSKDLGNSLLSGGDPMQSKIDQTKAGDTVDLSVNKLDQGGWLGGGACLPDRSIVLANHVIPVSFSSLCQNIIPLRIVIMSCALLVAYLLVSKSVLQG